MKVAGFRFDVDTHVGMREGVPRLLDLADRLNLGFTFFVNPGRTMSLRYSIARRARSAPSAPKLGLRRKLGTRGIVETILLNPRVADAGGESLVRMHDSHHQIGLHGGRNHAAWQYSARNWSRQRVRAEVAWGMARLASLGVEPPLCFSSPGWQGSNELDSVLSELGFNLVADAHHHGALQIEEKLTGMWSISTNLLGEPGGVGYITSALANGMTEDSIAHQFEEDVGTHGAIVVYDHPVVAGREGLSAVERIILKGRDCGYTWMTLGDIVRYTRERGNENSEST